MNKKGFTLIELLAVVVILGIVSAIAVGSYNKYLKYSKDKTFDLEVSSFKTSVNDAYTRYLSNKDNRLKSYFYDLDINGTTTIYLKQLVDYDYINKIKNPYNTKEFCDLENSYVKVSNKDLNGINKDLEYKVCLICGDKESSDCFIEE